MKSVHAQSLVHHLLGCALALWRLGAITPALWYLKWVHKYLSLLRKVDDHLYVLVEKTRITEVPHTKTRSKPSQLNGNNQDDAFAYIVGTTTTASIEAEPTFVQEGVKPPSEHLLANSYVSDPTRGNQEQVGIEHADVDGSLESAPPGNASSCGTSGEGAEHTHCDSTTTAPAESDSPQFAERPDKTCGDKMFLSRCSDKKAKELRRCRPSLFLLLTKNLKKDNEDVSEPYIDVRMPRGYRPYDDRIGSELEDEREKAAPLVREGVALCGEGKYEEGVDKFKTALRHGCFADAFEMQSNM